jgi:predicted metal-dependent phosphoesterase TrpH
VLHPPAAYLQKLLSPDRAAQMAREGWHAADLHVHSFCSEDVLPVHATDPRKMFEEGKRQGLKYVTFTDHDTMDAYDLVGWDREGLVPGVEFKVLDRQEVGHTIHVNVFLLNKHQFRELLGIVRKDQNLDRFLDFLQTHDLPHTYNHPFWFEEGERPNPEAVLRVAKRFPVIEYNRGRIRPLNLLALALAEKNGAGIVGCSDSHTGETLGTARTYAKGDTFREFFANVCDGNAYVLPLDMTLPRLVKEANQWIDLILSADQMIEQEQAAAFDMGVRPLEWLLHSMVTQGLASKPWFKRSLRGLLRTVSNAGVIQSFYIRSQGSIASRMRRQLGLSARMYPA